MNPGVWISHLHLVSVSRENKYSYQHIVMNMWTFAYFFQTDFKKKKKSEPVSG